MVSARLANDCEHATVPAFVVRLPIAKLDNPVKNSVSVLFVESFDQVWRDSMLVWGFVIGKAIDCLIKFFPGPLASKFGCQKVMCHQ